MTTPQLQTLTFRQKLKMTWLILHAINRQAELLRLIQWAQKRRFENPRKAYEKMYRDLEFKLMRFERDFPGQFRWAQCLHAISGLLSVKPYYRKGSAAPYRQKSR